MNSFDISLTLFFLVVKASCTVVWKESFMNAGSVDTCARYGLLPTVPDEYIPWNTSIFYAAVQSLNKSVYRSESRFGLFGCCAPGLWCNAQYCFTQGFNSGFSNYGTFRNETSLQSYFPVFSCDGDSSSSGGLVISDVVSNNGAEKALTIYGDGSSSYGTNESIVDVFVDGMACTDVELCNTVCDQCYSWNSCPSDSLCRTPTGSSTSHCYMYCSGPNDNSCPCNTHCVEDRVWLWFKYENLFLCLPDGSESCDDGSPNELQCDWQPSNTDIETRVMHNVSLTVAGKGASDENVYLSNGGTISCSSNDDCADADICTINVCNLVTRLCEAPVGNDSENLCQTTLMKVREQKTKYSYIMGYQVNMADVQSSFLNFLATSDNLLPHISGVDDYPGYTVRLNDSHEFDYFGNRITEFTINPNGVLLLPPSPYCGGLANSILCVIYATYSNTIAVWSNDWDLSVSPASSIFLYSQVAGDTVAANALYGIDANATHVLWQDVTQWTSEGTTPPNTFSISIYSDGSVRMSYHDVEQTVLSKHVFGVWGSRSSDSYLKYHEESMPYNLIDSGVDGIYCYLPNIIVSLVHNSVSANVSYNRPLMVQWTGDVPSTCNALGTEFSLVYSCNWNSGLVTPASVSRTNSLNLLTCNVPSMSYLSDGDVVSVDIGLAFNSSVSGHESVHVLSPMWDGSHAFYTVTREINNTATANGHIMVKYYQNAVTGNEGCSAISYYSNGEYANADRCGVCGGLNTTVDCADECFGSAFIDSCGKCAGGHSGATPDNTCFNFGDDDNSSSWNQTRTIIASICGVALLCFTVALCGMLRCCSNDDHVRHNRSTIPLPLSQRDISGVEFDFNPSMLESTDECKLKEEVEQVQPPPPPPPTQNYRIVSSLGKLPFFPRKKVEEGELEMVSVCDNPCPTECSICLCDFAPGDRCRKFPCKHVFHLKCVDKWLAHSSLCPLCKQSVTK